MVSNNYRRGLHGQRGKDRQFFELLSVPPEGNVFESVGVCGYVLCLVELRVFADATAAVGRGLVSWETAVDGTFAIQTCDVCDAGKRRAVLADRRVRRERNSAATTFLLSTTGEQAKSMQSACITENKHAEGARTTFEITSRVDTFPCTGTAAIHAAGRPSGSPF